MSVPGQEMRVAYFVCSEVLILSALNAAHGDVRRLKTASCRSIRGCFYLV